MKKIIMIVIGLFITLVFIGCGTDADIASRNLSYEADKFNIDRRIVFYNGISGEYILKI